MTFNALILDKDEAGETSVGIRKIDESQLPEGDVRVAVEYSCLNYKDGMFISPNGGRASVYPLVPGIDFSGKVETSTDARYSPGDKVLLTGWRVGETHWGGYAQKAQVKADWLVPMPAGLNTKTAMAVGTAGFTAMLAVLALEDRGLEPGSGPVLVTGAAGGVGSVAIAVLAQLGYEVAAVTGRPEAAEYLKSLGASQIVARSDLNEVSKRPLESQKWAGCIDTVGGEMLARILGQMKYGSSVAVIGLAGGAKFPGNVMPFILRGVNLLGVESVMQPYENRLRAWQRIGSDLPLENLESMVQMATLADLPQLGADILAGKIKGRVVVDVNA